MNDMSIPSGGKLTLAALAGSILLASLGISVATVALPTLARTFSASLQQVQWVVLAYLLSLTVSIVSVGRMGDLYGGRRGLMGGLVLFILTSIGCAVAPNLGWLIAGRVGQGFAAAALMALPISLAKDRVAKARLGAAMGWLGTMSAIGTALGPSLGGGLLDMLGWRSLFALLFLCGLGVLTLVAMGLPKEKEPPPGAARMDWAGSLWLFLALLLLALSAVGGKAGMPCPLWMLLSGAVIALAVFVGVEMRVAHPLVPLSLLGNRGLTTALFLNLLVSAVMMSTLVVGPFFLTFGLGLSGTTTGLVMAVGPAAAALSGVPAGKVTDLWGTERVLLAGLGLATCGLICFALWPVWFRTPGYVMALMLTTPGFQLFLAANNTATMAEAPGAQRGMVSGLLGLSRHLGFMTGASLMPLLFSTLLGDPGVVLSSPSVMDDAFSHTFLLIATGLGLVAAVFSRRSRARSPTA